MCDQLSECSVEHLIGHHSSCSLYKHRRKSQWVSNSSFLKKFGVLL